MVASAVEYDKIPNNVHLSSDRRLQRALEQWQPKYLEWWKEMGPQGFQEKDVYLRTAISVDTNGWANYDYVSMPDYRWGIFLAPPEANRVIPFGDAMGQPVWMEAPGEHRNALRRLIVTQADTEPASVEQQKLLGQTCPSLYDLRNLFQVNVEEGRHLWAMVYLLQSYFGRDGREEAEILLERRSGNQDKPRILTTFNEPISDWLSFFMFACFTDRDGKFQLLALSESGFDPLSRTCRFMLTEEAHHLFVGQSGIQRVIQRSAELMNQHNTDDIWQFGGVPLTVIQKYINFWYSNSVDLFGNEQSTNAANYFASGLKGRAYETKYYTEHSAQNGSFTLDKLENNILSTSEISLRNAMNEILRDEYIADAQKCVDKWNLELQRHHLDFHVKLPSKRFNRKVGMYSAALFCPEGKLTTQENWQKNQDNWLPTVQDKAKVQEFMQQVVTPGKIAGWIAPPRKGINGQPLDFTYVQL